MAKKKVNKNQLNLFKGEKDEGNEDTPLQNIEKNNDTPTEDTAETNEVGEEGVDETVDETHGTTLKDLERGTDFKVVTSRGSVCYLTVSEPHPKKEDCTYVYNHNTGNKILLRNDREVEMVDKIPQEILSLQLVSKNKAV